MVCFQVFWVVAMSHSNFQEKKTTNYIGEKKRTLSKKLGIFGIFSSANLTNFAKNGGKFAKFSISNL
jgi:hypothetical protein